MFKQYPCSLSVMSSQTAIMLFRLVTITTLIIAVTSVITGCGSSSDSSDSASETGTIQHPVSVDGLWVAVDEMQVPLSDVPPQAHRPYSLNQGLLEEALDRAPLEYTTETEEVVMTLPMPDGTYTTIRIEKSPIFSPEIQKRYPDVSTYRVQGLDDPTATGRFDLTPAGFHAILISERGTVYVDPLKSDDPSLYISYWKKDVEGEHYECLTHGSTETSALVGLSFPPNNPSGSQLRTYRLAISATGEYTQFFGGVANAAAQIATTVNRVTGIYEREVAISLLLTATNIYADPLTDPFTGNNVSAMLGENQTDLDANVLDANYDFGHIFSQGGGGGVANQGVCVTGSKARGATSLGNPAGDVFDVDFVSHEMGHQLSGSHTWNGTSGSCSAGQFVASSAYEPASGSTIMAYAGICGGQNVQPNSDDYFHTRSFDQITAYRDGTGACGTVTATGNNPPTVEAGPNCTIPTDTPFRLTATGDDVDGDALTFNWEQFDLGTRDGNPVSTFVTGPLFRSREATSDETRTFPRFEDILSGAPTPYEVLPTVSRTLDFRVTARDNRANGGGVDYDSMTVTVDGDPFAITAPAAAASLECGVPTTVAWTVGGGSIASDVEILFSSDGGGSFSSLIGSTPNDGAHDVVPVDLTSTGRIMLEPSSACFFAVSEEFSIVDSIAPTITAPADVSAECTSPAGTPVVLGTPVTSDMCDASLAIENDAPVLFPLGSTPVAWTATDDSGNTGLDTQTVTIVDTNPPDFDLSVTPDMLWPPDHRMVTIQTDITVEDVCSEVTVRLVSITSNEPDNGTGDGDTTNDIQGAAFGNDDREFQLRAERSGNGNGRVYTITYEAEDTSGNTTVRQATVTVPKSQR